MKGNMIKITEIKTEHKVNALGVDGNPLIRWKYEGDDQISYRLKVKLSEVYGKGDVCVFDSGEVNSADNFCRADGKKLERGKKYDVVISLNGEKATEGGESYFQTAIIREDFKGDWVNLPVNSQGGSSLYRIRGKLEKKPVLATAYVAGIGYNELYINGKKVGDELLSPATSDYAKRIYYNTYDVTDILEIGDNVFGVEVARLARRKAHAFAGERVVRRRNGNRISFGGRLRLVGSRRRGERKQHLRR